MTDPPIIRPRHRIHRPQTGCLLCKEQSKDWRQMTDLTAISEQYHDWVWAGTAEEHYGDR